MAAPDQKPLPFIYQFAAGAVAGVSEVLDLGTLCGPIDERYWLTV